MSSRFGLTHEMGPFANNVQFRTVVLVGHMGAGKSSVGGLLNRKMGWPFEDLDARIQHREKRTIAEIFRSSGESEFRRVEHAALAEILTEVSSQPRIIALGGGAFARAENQDLLRRPDIVSVFLDGPANELFRRCQHQSTKRPLMSDEEQFASLYAERRDFYMTATLRIDTAGKTIDAVAMELATMLESRT